MSGNGMLLKSSWSDWSFKCFNCSLVLCLSLLTTLLWSFVFDCFPGWSLEKMIWEEKRKVCVSFFYFQWNINFRRSNLNITKARSSFAHFVFCKNISVILYGLPSHLLSLFAISCCHDAKQISGSHFNRLFSLCWISIQASGDFVGSLNIVWEISLLDASPIPYNRLTPQIIFLWRTSRTNRSKSFACVRMFYDFNCSTESISFMFIEFSSAQIFFVCRR